MIVTEHNNFVEVLQHQVKWYLHGTDPTPEELNEFQLAHLHAMILDGYNQGELLAHGPDGEISHRGWWEITTPC